MTRGHRRIADLLAGEGRRPSDVRATVIDTPYGFQSNADALTAGLVDFFSQRVGLATTVASFRRSDENEVTAATALTRIEEADFVFAGPGPVIRYASMCASPSPPGRGTSPWARSTAIRSSTISSAQVARPLSPALM